MNSFNLVFEAVKKIPKGKVTTYGEIAKYVGINNPRIVGFALHANKNPDEIPCHRVVNIKGELAKGYVFGGLNIQKKLLINEGVEINNNKIDLSRYIFHFKLKSLN